MSFDRERIKLGYFLDAAKKRAYRSGKRTCVPDSPRRGNLCSTWSSWVRTLRVPYRTPAVGNGLCVCTRGKGGEKNFVNYVNGHSFVCPQKILLKNETLLKPQMKLFLLYLKTCLYYYVVMDCMDISVTQLKGGSLF